MSTSNAIAESPTGTQSPSEEKPAYCLKRGDTVNVYRDVWKTVASASRHGSLSDGYVEVRMTDGTTKVWFCSWKVGIRA